MSSCRNDPNGIMREHNRLLAAAGDPEEMFHRAAADRMVAAGMAPESVEMFRAAIADRGPEGRRKATENVLAIMDSGFDLKTLEVSIGRPRRAMKICEMGPEMLDELIEGLMKTEVPPECDYELDEDASQPNRLA